MRKLILIVIALAYGLFCFSQNKEFPLNSDRTEVYYTEVVNVDSISKQILFGKVREWFISKYVSYKTICQLEDETTGVIIVKSFFDVYSYAIGKTKVGVIEYTFKIQVKDNRYKYEIYDIRHLESKLKTPGNLLFPKPSENEDLIMNVSWDGIKKQAHSFFDKLIVDIKSKVKIESKSDNW